MRRADSQFSQTAHCRRGRAPKLIIYPNMQIAYLLFPVPSEACATVDYASPNAHASGLWLNDAAGGCVGPGPFAIRPQEVETRR